MNYGQSQAVIVLAGQRMGITIENAENAEKLLKGEAVHAMHGAAISREATAIHNQISVQPAEVMAQANKHCDDLISEYGLH